MDQARPHRWIRILVVVLGVLAIACAGLGFLPGREIHELCANCVGDIGAYVGTERVAYAPWKTAAYFLVTAAPGALLWRSPRLVYVLAWWAFGVAATVAFFLWTFDLNIRFSQHVTTLWPVVAMSIAATAFVVTLLAIAPIACAVDAFVARRRARPEPLPRARLV